MPIQDRRRHPRVSAELDVEYGIGPELATGKIVDIGVAGFGIVGENAYPAGTQVELRIRAPGTGEDMKMKAVVCFSNPKRMGVQVISVPAEHANVLESIYALISRDRPQ